MSMSRTAITLQRIIESNKKDYLDIQYLLKIGRFMTTSVF